MESCRTPPNQESQDTRFDNISGYVPCLVAGSFLLDEGQLTLNAFFRSQSIVEFGLYDLLFLRDLQSEMAERFAYRNGAFEIACGSLNLTFGRIIVQRRLARRRKRTPMGTYQHVHLPRDSTFRKWVGVLSKFTEGYDCSLSCGPL
jgi:hypothetical protein